MWELRHSLASLALGGLIVFASACSDGGGSTAGTFGPPLGGSTSTDPDTTSTPDSDGPGDESSSGGDPTTGDEAAGLIEPRIVFD